MKQPANPETHLGALALHPVEQLLDVDPRPVKLQGSPLRSSDDSNQPSFVAMFVFRGLVDRANEVGSIIINVITGLPASPCGGQLSISLVMPSISARTLSSSQRQVITSSNSVCIASSCRTSKRFGALKTVWLMISCFVIVGSGRTADGRAEEEDG